MVLSHRNVIQEKQRPGTLHEHIIDAHGHSVDANGVMFVHGKGNQKLGSDAICAGNQHRFLHTVAGKVKQSPEGSDGILCSPDSGSVDMTADPPHGFIAGFQTHTGFFILFCHFLHPFVSLHRSQSRRGML